MNDKTNKIFLSVFLISFILYSAYLLLIVKFTILPIIFFSIGLIIYLLLKKQGIYYLLLLFPFINSFPSIFKIGYPHNYFSLSLFLFSGVIIYYFFYEFGKSKTKINIQNESWEKHYWVFLIILFLSSLFLFLRWSNVTISLRAFLKDTPITPSGERLSFGAIFPLLTLFHFSIIPVLYIFFKNKRLDRFKAFKYLSLGFFISVLFAIVQKFINDEFLVTRYGTHIITKQLKNGGFCDQNSFIFFSGVLLLLSILFFNNNRKIAISVAILSLTGGILTGAKVFYIFIVFAIILLFLALKISNRKKIIVSLITVLSLSFLIFILGNTGNTRVKKSFDYLKKSFSGKSSKDRFFLLNHATNGRLEMISNSFNILKKYPLEGVGSGNFLFYNEYQNLEKPHTHDLTLNEYLRVLTETGFIGFVFFSLFMISLLRKFKKEKFLGFIFILFILVFNNYLWFPENIVLFPLLIYMLSDNSKNRKTTIHKSYIIFSITALLLFSLFNIINFNKLHPLTWSLEKGKDYDYGFWYEERDNKGEIYKWTKKSAGIFISEPDSFKIKLFCGAPIDKIKGKKQTIIFFVNGKKIKNIVFKTNEFKDASLNIKKPFFLELKVFPTFNLYKMGLGQEKRELGIILYYKFKHNNPKSSITTPYKTLKVYQGEKTNIIFKIKNNSKETISSNNGYFFSYHILNKKGEKIKFDNRRFPINKTIKTNEISSLTIPFYFDYPLSGEYIVNFDIVKEGFYWLSSLGWKTPELNLKLRPLISKEFKQEFLKSFIDFGENSLLNKEQHLLRLTLKNNEIKKRDNIIGFSPGSDYPQFWIRDIATFVKYGKLFYPLSVFKNQIEKFLSIEKPDGNIPDWYDLTGKSDKNSVESDQESSLLIAAYEIFLSEPKWIKKNIKNGKIINLLEKSLDYLWENKRIPGYNLIYGGLTADWGDVENSYPDQRAVKLSSRSTKVFSIYTQAKYIQAVKKIISIFEYLNDKKKVLKWQKRLSLIKKDTIKYLYDSNKGYFKIHYYPEAINYYDIERKIFATGGNAEAIISGIVNKKQAIKIIRIFENRKNEYNLKGVSWTLIPPYPEGFFKHPLLKNQWSYQNGGQWDWIGLRMIKAMFEYGLKNKADFYFKNIIKKHLRNFNIFEWEDKNNIGRGAFFYTGAAGISGEIIFKYYGGFNENTDNYIISFKNKSIKIIIDGDTIFVNKKLKTCKCRNKKLIVKF